MEGRGAKTGPGAGVLSPATESLEADLHLRYLEREE